MTKQPSSQVVIAGGGVAALEALMALRDLAGERVAITLIAPETTFTYRPMKVAEPFYKGHAHEYGLLEITRDHGARFIHDSVAEVHTEEKVVRCASGAHIPFDHLVIATGAKAVPAFRDALTFGEDPSEERLHGMLADLEQGYLKHIAFVVPGETVWTLPLYELALMTARQAWGMGMENIQFTLVTPEERPLAMFGGPASEAVAQMLSDEGIEFVGSSYPTVGHGYVVADPGGRRIDADRAVSLPALEGRRLAGVPADEATGSSPSTPTGACVASPACTPRVTASTSPSSKAASRPSRPTPWPRRSRRRSAQTSIPEPFRPVLRGLLLTGGDDRFMRHTVAGGGGEGEVSGRTLWWPPTKIAGRYISGYLFDRDDAQIIEDIHSHHLEIEIPLDAHAAAGHS